MSSVVGAATVSPRTVLAGVAEYTGDQIRVEPAHSPETEPERRAILEAERPSIGAFDYADLPGHAVITVKGAAVEARVFSGIRRKLWRTVDLSKLLSA